MLEVKHFERRLEKERERRQSVNMTDRLRLHVCSTFGNRLLSPFRDFFLSFLPILFYIHDSDDSTSTTSSAALRRRRTI